MHHEPFGGSDVGGIRTKLLDDEDYVINGSKTFTMVFIAII